MPLKVKKNEPAEGDDDKQRGAGQGQQDGQEGGEESHAGGR